MTDQAWPILVEDNPERNGRAEIVAVVAGAEADACAFAVRWNADHPEAAARGARAGADYAVPFVTEVGR